MQKTRGIIYFEGKNTEEIKEGIKPFDELKFSYFESLERKNDEIDKAGIFIDGAMQDSLVLNEVIDKMRLNLGLEAGMKQCDISAENDGDKLVYIKQGELTGNYVGIRINSELNEEIEKLAIEIGNILEAKNVLIRDVENDKGAKVCIDIITDKAYSDFQKQVEQRVQEKGLKINDDEYIILNLK